jgi:hypothetical protein
MLTISVPCFSSRIRKSLMKARDSDVNIFIRLLIISRNRKLVLSEQKLFLDYEKLFENSITLSSLKGVHT